MVIGLGSAFQFVKDAMICHNPLKVSGVGYPMQKALEKTHRAAGWHLRPHLTRAVFLCECQLCVWFSEQARLSSLMSEEDKTAPFLGYQNGLRCLEPPALVKDSPLPIGSPASKAWGDSHPGLWAGRMNPTLQSRATWLGQQSSVTCQYLRSHPETFPSEDLVVGLGAQVPPCTPSGVCQAHVRQALAARWLCYPEYR